MGLGACTMLAPTYTSENSPRAIRGLLIGFWQLLLVTGTMVAYYTNYGCLLHLKVSLCSLLPYDLVLHVELTTT